MKGDFEFKTFAKFLVPTLFTSKAFIGIYRVLKEINPDVVHFVTIKPVLYGGIASRFLNTHKKLQSQLLIQAS
ncbi:MAG TPA: glycosyltransferase, partial [bacterium]|nr:glycosyltransferase [bacterium]